MTSFIKEQNLPTFKVIWKSLNKTFLLSTWLFESTRRIVLQIFSNWCNQISTDYCFFETNLRSLGSILVVQTCKKRRLSDVSSDDKKRPVTNFLFSLQHRGKAFENFLIVRLFLREAIFVFFFIGRIKRLKDLFSRTKKKHLSKLSK